MSDELNDYLDIEDGYLVEIPENVVIANEAHLKQILESEEFVCYVRVLADKNPFYVRNGYALQMDSFLLDLAKCTEAARETYDAKMVYEGTTFEQYQKEHYSECMIDRDETFRNTHMPHEIEIPSLKVLEKLLGTLHDDNMRRYHKQIAPMLEEEIIECVQRFRNIPETFGIKLSDQFKK